MNGKKYTKFFLDTEFDENGETIKLISIGVTCLPVSRAKSKYMYCISSDVNYNDCNDWVKENVLPNLVIEGNYVDVMTNSEIAKKLLEFVTDNTIPGTKPEFWAYYADYDWVVLCQLFGRMIDLPKNFPMFCMDIKQHSRTTYVDSLPKQSKKHNALEDARWCMKAWKHIDLHM